MKIKYVFLSMLACGMLAACSNDEVAEGSNTTNLGGGEAYVKVRIAMSDGAASRATSGGYDYGTTTEQAIQNIQFAFYDNEGNWVADGIRQGQTTVDPTEETNSPNDGNVEGIAEAVVALILDEGVDKPTKVIAYVNVPTGFSTSGQSISQMKELIAESSVSTENNFIMTNSTYYNSGEVIATSVPSDKFKDSESEALADDVPVEIYVERLAAKVKVEQGDNLSSNMPDLKNGGYTLSFKLEGFALNATNNKEYYLKNLDAAWNETTPWNGWNDASDSRCFWSKDPNYDSAPGASDLTFVSYNEVDKLAANKTSHTEYCKENTLTGARYTAGNFTECTHALIVGHYELTDNDNPDAGVIKGDDDKPITFYMYRNTAYLEDDLMNIIANNGFVYVKTSDAPVTYEIADADAYKLVQTKNEVTVVDGADNNKLTAALNWEEGNEQTYYMKEGSDFTPITKDNLATINEEIATVGTIEVYTNGMGYFAVPIEHLATSGDGQYGVVRNHSYVLTVESITGLADGIFNPGDPIVPTPPVKKYYVGATLNILSWHVVNQSVNL